MSVKTMLTTAVFISVLAMGMPISVSAQEEPVFLDCICFDPGEPMSRQDARDECDDPIAGDYRAGVFRPSIQFCIQDCPSPQEAWGCFGVGGFIGVATCPPNCGGGGGD